MAQFLSIHPVNPQQRLLDQAVAVLEGGGIIAYPTDTTYGLGCSIFNPKGIERILRIKQLPASHQLSILIRDLSEIATYARVDNPTYRILKRHLPGPYTFVLNATREVPKTLLPKRQTIGLRIPNHPICLGLLRTFGKPLLSTSLRFPGDNQIMTDPEDFKERLEHAVDLVIDGGILPAQASTIVDLSGESGPVVLRVGAGDPVPFQSEE